MTWYMAVGYSNIFCLCLSHDFFCQNCLALHLLTYYYGIHRYTISDIHEQVCKILRSVIFYAIFFDKLPKMQPCSSNCYIISRNTENPTLNESEKKLVQKILNTFQPSSCLAFLALKYAYKTKVTCAQLFNIYNKSKSANIYKKPVKYASSVLNHDFIVHYNPCSHLGSCLRNKTCGCYRNKTYCESMCNCECCDMVFEPCNCETCDIKCRCYINARECTEYCHRNKRLDKIKEESKVSKTMLEETNPGVTKAMDKEMKKDECNKRYKPDIDARPDSIYNALNAKVDTSEQDLYTKVNKNVYDCGNKNIALHRHAKTYIGESLIAGFGLFAFADLEKNTFVIEYVGELISHNEAERRGFFYDRKKISYLFDLSIRNDEDYGTIDATRIGNSSRFINHSINANLEARQMMVNGVLRMGFYTIKDIKKGEELFFDYKYNDNIKKIFNLKD